MKKANILLRQADHKRKKNDNKNITLLKPEQFIQDITINSLDLELVQRIKNDASYINKLVKKALDTKNKKQRQEVNKLIYQQYKLYISQNNKLREDIIIIHHNGILAKHSRCHKTLELINYNHQWLCIAKQI